MPSLYKADNLTAADKKSVPVINVQVATRPTAEQATKDLAIGEAVDALFTQRWAEAKQELLTEREKMLADIEKTKKQTYDQAYQEGLAAGKAVARRQAEQMMQSIREVEQRQLADRKDFIVSCKTEITELIISATESLIKAELQSPERVTELVSQAISELVSRQKVVLYVHPERLNEVQAYSYLLPATQDGQDVIFRGDPTLGKQVFRVEDDSGSVVVDLPAEIMNLRHELSHD